MDFKKLEHETENDYVFRVCNHKSEIGSWEDVTVILNTELHQNKSDNAYRKKYEYMLKSQVADIDGDIDNEEPVKPKVLDTDKYSIDKQKINADKIEINRFLRQHSRFELFYEKVRDVIKPLPCPEFQPIDTSVPDSEYVLTFSDIHYGSAFTSENNSYSPGVAESRMRILAGHTIRFIQEHNIQRLSIVNLGDDIQGILRLSDLKLNDYDIVESVVFVARMIASFLNSLSEYAKIDYYAVSASNHSQTRNLGSRASELAGEDVEKIINAYIHDVLAQNERINVIYNMNKDYLSFKVMNFNIVAMHGHQIKNVDSAIKDVSALHQQFYDYMLLGHYHSAKEITVGERDMHNVEVLMSPSIIGSCPYADTIMKGSKASAKIYEFAEDYGHVSSKTFILN